MMLMCIVTVQLLDILLEPIAILLTCALHSLQITVPEHHRLIRFWSPLALCCHIEIDAYSKLQDSEEGLNG